MVQITEVNREPATTVSTLTATTEVTSPSVTADSATVTNAVDAGSVTADSASVTNAVDAGSVTTDTLEATESITDPDGNTVTSLSDPVRVTEEAVTFEEANVTLSTSSTRVNNGSVELLSGTQDSTASIPDSDTTNFQSGAYGLRINPNGSIESITVTLMSDVSFGSNIYLYRVSDGELLDEVSGSFGGGDSVTLTPDDYLIEGKNYNVVVDADDAESGALDSPVESEAFDIVAGGAKGATGTTSFNVAYNIVTISAEGAPAPTNGSAVVSLGTETLSDIDSNDLATFQATEDGETVKVDIEDSNGNVLKSDIAPNNDISDIPADTEIQFRVKLSRQNTANNPTLDYLAWRATR